MIGHLYRAFDAEGTLLYVGVSMNALQRLSQHKTRSDWFGHAETVRIERFPTLAEAYEAETAAIASESPKYNRAPGTGRAQAEVVERQRKSRAETHRRSQERQQEHLNALLNERKLFYFPKGDIACRNCAYEPLKLPKGKLLSELECPDCECAGTLAIVERKAKAA